MSGYLGLDCSRAVHCCLHCVAPVRVAVTRVCVFFPCIFQLNRIAWPLYLYCVKGGLYSLIACPYPLARFSTRTVPVLVLSRSWC